MSDFFMRMAERALGKGASVRPLIASRFAPSNLSNPSAPAMQDSSSVSNEATNSVGSKELQGRDASRPAQDSDHVSDANALTRRALAPQLSRNPIGNDATTQAIYGHQRPVVSQWPNESTASRSDRDNALASASQSGAEGPVHGPTRGNTIQPTTASSVQANDNSLVRSKTREGLDGPQRVERAVPTNERQSDFANTSATLPRYHAQSDNPSLHLETALGVLARREHELLPDQPTRLATQRSSSSETDQRQANHDAVEPDRSQADSVNLAANLTANLVEQQPTVVKVTQVTIGRIEVRVHGTGLNSTVQPPPPATRPALGLDAYLKREQGNRP